MENQINKKKLLLYGFLKAIQCEFFGFFLLLFYIAVSKAMGVFANILFGFAGICTVICIMADLGLKQGEKANNKVKLHGAEPCRNFGLKIGLVAAIPSFVTFFLLVLSYFNVIGNFIPAYKISNACFFPIIDLVAHSASISDLNPAALILFAFLPFFFVLSGWLSFKWGYDQVDLKSKVLYKNK